MKRLNVNDLDGCTFMSSDLVTLQRQPSSVKHLFQPPVESLDTNATDGAGQMSGFVVTLPVASRIVLSAEVTSAF